MNKNYITRLALLYNTFLSDVTLSVLKMLGHLKVSSWLNLKVSYKTFPKEKKYVLSLSWTLFTSKGHSEIHSSVQDWSEVVHFMSHHIAWDLGQLFSIVR